jgi:hypothetical protein
MEKGISQSVVALILLIASVIVALVVASFTFSLAGEINQPTVTPIGTASMTYNNDYYIVNVTLKTTQNVEIIKSCFNDLNLTNNTLIQLSSGINHITLYFYSKQTLPNGVYTLTLTTNYGETIKVAVNYY